MKPNSHIRVLCSLYTYEMGSSFITEAPPSTPPPHNNNIQVHTVQYIGLHLSCEVSGTILQIPVFEVVRPHFSAVSSA